MKNRKIDDNLLENVSGGYLYKNDRNLWEVIDNNGNVVYTGVYLDTEQYANNHHISTEIIDYRKLERIRERKSRNR